MTSNHADRERWSLPHAVRAELVVSQQLGLIGPSPIDDHVDHAVGFAAGPAPARAADLGSGGGLPSLVLAAVWPDSEWTLIDRRERAIARLDVMVARLGWSPRIELVLASAEEAGHRPTLRGAFDLVTARGFGPPAITAECGAPLLRLGGRLVVSEPPEPASRWPEPKLTGLGLRRIAGPDRSYVALEAVEPCPARFPRRRGRPRQRPLW